MTIYPVEGRTVRDPVTGREVTGPLNVAENDSFWIRCLRAGDITRKKPEEKKGEKK